MKPQGYQLPVRLLLETMHTLGETAVLRALLPGAHESNEGAALAEVVVELGNVVSCSIRALQTGALLAQDTGALHHLLTHTDALEWEVVPRASLAADEVSLSLVSLFTEPSSASSESNERKASGQPDERMNIPRQATTLHDTRVALLPPKGRQVFLLSNGARSCQEIARLLGVSGESLDEVMRTLSEQRLIVWQAPSR